ncbi:MAG: tripartite tricarboxylate transporter substrate binding protein [Betaproteobacteria bacterium]|nr:tripartite tricarboxylate transporter substrate binding protein [Betaproteobacteria bacterium]
MQALLRVIPVPFGEDLMDWANADRRPAWVRFTLLAALLLAGGAAAQDYPAKTIRFIVPFAPGGGADILARSIGQKLSEKWGQPVVVDNRPGASAIIGTEAAAKAAPDGYTIVIIATGHTVNPSLYRKLPYNTLRDFAPVTQLTSSPNVLVVHPSVPVKTARDLIGLARKRPAELNYSSAGNGTAGHLSAELFKLMARVNAVHVPYKSAPQALTDLLTGQVQLQFSNLMAALPHIKTARLRALAVTTVERSPAIPELPTMEEAGLPGYRVDQTYGVLAPAGTSAAIIDKLNAEIVNILKTPEFRRRMTAEGALLVGNSPQQYESYLRAEIEKWTRVVQHVGIRVD